jgi:uncharacterized protein (DUF362 family)/Pyruvate/2-oxoacid:ferredoxin oxidoreductase delta subunit
MHIRGEKLKVNRSVMKYQVAVNRCVDYDPDHLIAALQKSLLPWGGMKGILGDAKTVLLKLNLLGAAPPEAAVTTHPAFAQAVLTLIQEEGVHACMGDSPGGIQNRASFERLLEVTGIGRVARETGCPVIFFDEDMQPYHSPKSRTFKKFSIPRILTSVDAVIALPRFKTHQLTTITGAVKLLYGYLPGSLKAEYHLHTGKKVSLFAELLCDLYATFPPTFTLMDAIVAMEGNGPRHGTPRHLGLVLSGPSGPALDFVMADLVGLEPLQIPSIRNAADRGLGPTHIEEIEMFGKETGNMRCTDFLPPDAHRLRYVPEFFLSAAQQLAAPRPVIDPSQCRSCGVCVTNCPAQAIRKRRNGTPVISSSRCIRCFCCQELCPANAITVRFPLLRRMLRR